MRYILFSSFLKRKGLYPVGYTEGVSKGIFSIREKTGLDSKTGQTRHGPFFIFLSNKKPPFPTTNLKILKLSQRNSLNPPNGVYRSLALATAVILLHLRFYISGTSTYEVGNSPIPIYTYSILLLVLSVVYMCVSYSYLYISILYLYTTTLSYISFSKVFTLRV